MTTLLVKLVRQEVCLVHSGRIVLLGSGLLLLSGVSGFIAGPSSLQFKFSLSGIAGATDSKEMVEGSVSAVLIGCCVGVVGRNDALVNRPSLDMVIFGGAHC